MRFVIIAGTGALGLLAAAPAHALTISNLDAKPHTVSVGAGDAAKELTVEPTKAVEAPCEQGCQVKLDNGEIYELKGGEAVSINGGALFIDHSPDQDVAGIPDIDPDTVKEETDDEPADEGSEDDQPE